MKNTWQDIPGEIRRRIHIGDLEAYIFKTLFEKIPEVKVVIGKNRSTQTNSKVPRH